MSIAFPAQRFIPSRVKCLSFLKSQSHNYFPWQQPLSERQINTYFEQQILPDLTVLLENFFQDFVDSDREEAIQDATCQALEAYRILRLYENSRVNTAHIETAFVLAKFASSQYLAGIRFAAPRSTSCL